jgi:AAA family ATP:ADP antiporter
VLQENSLDPLPLTEEQARRKGPLEKLLSIISDVRPGEGLGALVLTLNLVVLLGSYYLLKIVRESLILAEGGAEIKAYSSAAQALILFGVVPLYGWIGTKLNRVRLLRFSTLFFASNLLIFFALGRAGVRVAIPYYIWVGIFNVFSVAQLWSFATDLVTEEQGKRLFPLFGVGASIGAVGGAALAARIIKPLGPFNLMLLAAVGLVLCALLTRIAGYLLVRHGGEREREKDKETLGAIGGFQLLLSDHYLMLIAILTTLLNIVTVSGDYIFGKLLLEQTNVIVGSGPHLLKARQVFIGAYYAQYYEWTNILSFAIQTFLVSRIFKRIGIRGSLFVLPAISLATFISIFSFPVLGVVRALKVAENSTLYSLQNTVRHALLLPTSREAKYKAKAAIDTFCVRIGDVLQAGIIFIGTALHFALRSFAAVSLVIVAVWFFVAFRLYQEHKRKLPDLH